MSHGTWRPPTVESTIRTSAVRSVFGNGTSRPVLAFWVLVLLLLILAMPSVDSYGYNPIYLVLGPVVGSANAAWREREFGGPRRIVIAAWLTSLTCFILWVALFAALSILFGPEAGSSPIESLIESLPPINAVSILLALLILLSIRYYWIQRPALKRERAAFQAHAAAERAARAEAFGR